jgi:hypothetical protein
MNNCNRVIKLHSLAFTYKTLFFFIEYSHLFLTLFFRHYFYRHYFFDIIFSTLFFPHYFFDIIFFDFIFSTLFFRPYFFDIIFSTLFFRLYFHILFSSAWKINRKALGKKFEKSLKLIRISKLFNFFRRFPPNFA